MILTLGNQPSGENGAAIYDMQVDGTLVHQFTMSEQGCHNSPLLMPSGEVVIGGSDPTNGGWDLGNIYVLSGGEWLLKRTLPNVIHTLGTCHHNGLLYVATGAHVGDNETWEGRVFWSDDVGETWPGSSLVTSYRVLDIASFNGKLYTTDTTYYANEVHVSDDGGEAWQLVAGILPRLRPRMVEYGSKLLIVKNDLSGFATIDDQGNVGNLAVPEALANYYNTTAVIGTDLYVLCGSQSNHVRRYDGSQWHYHCDLGEPCCSLINFEDQFLIASTIGVDAKILRVPLN